MTPPNRTYNVLILCTGNSARSILGEVLVNHWGRGRFKGFSAGSHPKGQVHPDALELIRSLGWPTEGLRSKSWDEFAVPGAPTMDVVITVCDNAAGETCPVWLGTPTRAHWGLPDPAAVADPVARRQAFRSALDVLSARIQALTALDPERLEPAALKQRLDEIALIGSVGSDAAS
ncbi:MAG: arsenate reductase ArsC [Gemmatimonadaceae bacterium]